MHPTTARVAAALKAAGIDTEIREFSEATRTAQQAADALGVPVGAIVKSLCFAADGRPVMVLTSGAHRVDVGKLASLVGASTITRADAAMVRAATGFAIGGVPPIAHSTAMLILLDQELSHYTQLWAAAGTPHSVFRTSPAELAALTGARFVDIAQDQSA